MQKNLKNFLSRGIKRDSHVGVVMKGQKSVSSVGQRRQLNTPVPGGYAGDGIATTADGGICAKEEGVKTLRKDW